VIDVQRVQAKRERGRQRSENVQQRDGIGAAGDSDQDDVAGREHRVPPNRTLHRVHDVHA
jgi:hypothetical protein